MSDSIQPTILCLASFFKGNEFIRECRQRGASVILLTREKLDAADWARESLAGLVAIPGQASVQSYLAAASHVARRRRISRVVALEEYDIVTAAHVREHLCVPGMGTTTARCFQDKLAMRTRARDLGIPQPEFVSLLNHQAIDEFMKRTSAPWMLKPRIGASSMGIRKLHKPEQVWRAITELDGREAFREQSGFYLLEHYTPGDVYHVDSLITGGKIVFASVERYGAPPFDVSHFGGVTISHSIRHGSPEQRLLLALNKKLLQGFGIERGVTHAEFIQRAPEPAANANESSQFYFLEVAARVGGAYTAETIAAATGINPWREWAGIELDTPEHPYILPTVRREHGGLVLTLARQEQPNTAAYTDPEIVHRVSKPWHVGLIVRSPEYQRVAELLSQYAGRFHEDFAAVAPPEETPQQHL